MSKKKERKIDLNDLTPEEACKLEIAEEIGVYDKVLEGGMACPFSKRIRENRRNSKQAKESARKNRKRRTKTRNKQDRKHRPENRAYEV